MASEASAADTGAAPVSLSPSSDYQVSSQPLVIDCPDSGLNDSAAAAAAVAEGSAEVTASAPLHNQNGIGSQESGVDMLSAQVNSGDFVYL